MTNESATTTSGEPDPTEGLALDAEWSPGQIATDDGTPFGNPLPDDPGDPTDMDLPEMPEELQEPDTWYTEPTEEWGDPLDEPTASLVFQHLEEPEPSPHSEVEPPDDWDPSSGM